MSTSATPPRPARLLLQWDPPEDPGVVGARIFRADGEEGEDGDWTPIADVPGDRLEVDGALPWRRYRFAAAPLFADGNVAPRGDWVFVDAEPSSHPERPALPDTVTGFGASQQGAILHFEWTPNEDGVTEGYEIRRGQWAGGLLVGRSHAPFFEAPWWNASDRDFVIAAFDRLGQYGSTASVEVQIKALPDFVTIATTDEKGAGFAGTKTNTEVSGGNLRLAAIPAAISAGSGTIDSYTSPCWSRYWHSGSYTTAAMDLGVVGRHRMELTLTPTMTMASSLVIDDYGGTIGPPRLTAAGDFSDPITRGHGENHACDGTVLLPCSIVVEIDTTPDSGGSPTWDGYRRYVPGEFYARQVRFKFTLTGDGLIYPVISAMTFTQRQKNLKDEVTIAVAGTPGPTAVTWAAPFTGTPTVVATVVDAAGTEFTALAADITSSGANVRAYDAAGAEVFTGTIHVIAAGV